MAKKDKSSKATAKEEKDKKPEFKIVRSKEYISLFLGIEQKDSEKKEEKDGKAISTLISLLTEKEDKQIKEDALKALKNEAGKELLLKAIAISEVNAVRRILVAACWEAGLDFSKYLPFFIRLAIISDLQICLDVLTIVEDMQGPFENKALLDAIKNLEEAGKVKDATTLSLYEDMIGNLKRHLTN